MIPSIAASTVTCVTPQAVLHACTRRGLSARQILDSARLDRSALVDPGARVALEQVNALWQRACAAARDEAIAVEAARQLPVGAYRVFDYLLVHSATMLEGVQRVIQTYPLLNSGFRFQLVRRGVATHLQLAPQRGNEPIPRLYSLFIHSVVLQRVEWMLGSAPPVREVCFNAPAPPDCGALARHFTAPLRFAQSRDEIVFDSDALAAPSRFADPQLCEVLDSHARQLLRAAAAPLDFAASVRDAVAHGVRGGRCELVQIAAQLALSPRSLQRRLAEQGTSFQRLLDDTRRERCATLLRHKGVPLAEVSCELGFSEPSAFHRAFKRWTGMTPGEFLQ